MSSKEKIIGSVTIGVISLFGLIIIAAIFAGDSQDSQPKQEQPKKESKQEQTTATAAEYEIVETKDASHKALEKPLSSYTLAELDALPIDKKMSYTVLVSPKIKEAQVKPTIDKIISDITSKDKDIDEITIFLYSDKEIIGQAYDVAKATWAPGGKLGNVTPEIAKTNTRNGYKTSIEIKENLEEYLRSRSKAEEKFGLTEGERRNIYKEIAEAEAKAMAEADKLYPIDATDPNYKQENVMKNIDKADELEKKYTAEVIKKYGITDDIATKITVEALTENWPLK